MRSGVIPYVYNSVSVSPVNRINGSWVNRPSVSQGRSSKGSRGDLTRNNSLDSRAFIVATMVVILKSDGAIFVSRFQIREIRASKLANGFLQVSNEGFTRHRLLRL